MYVYIYIYIYSYVYISIVIIMIVLCMCGYIHIIYSIVYYQEKDNFIKQTTKAMEAEQAEREKKITAIQMASKEHSGVRHDP